jgi:hypothetical protein
MSSPLAPVFEHFIDFLVEKASPAEILAFRITETDRERAIALLDKQDSGELTAEEAAELDQMRQIDRLVSILHARATMAIRRQP